MNRLERYLQEREEQSPIDERELQLEESPAVEALLGVFEQYIRDIDDIWCQHLFSKASDLISGIEYTAQDVCGFSLHMKQYESHESFHGANTGVFISALVEEGDDSAYTIFTEHLENPLDYLGMLNMKDLTILGGAGDCLGFSMFSGSIRVKGNAGYKVGNFLHDGTIYVEGNGEECAAGEMLGGRVIVEGDVGPSAGVRMEGGILVVEGDIVSISDSWKGGEIYEAGKLVRPLPEDSK